MSRIPWSADLQLCQCFALTDYFWALPTEPAWLLNYPKVFLLIKALTIDDSPFFYKWYLRALGRKGTLLHQVMHAFLDTVLWSSCVLCIWKSIKTLERKDWSHHSWCCGGAFSFIVSNHSMKKIIHNRSHKPSSEKERNIRWVNRSY